MILPEWTARKEAGVTPSPAGSFLCPLKRHFICLQTASQTTNKQAPHMRRVNRVARSLPRREAIENLFPRPAAGRRFSRFSPLFPPRETDLQQILPPSRRTKAFFERFYRLPAAENRFSEIFSHFPPREGVFLRIYPISRRGKAFSESFDRFPAAGRRF